MHPENVRRADRAEEAAANNHSEGNFADFHEDDQQDAIADLICNLGHVAKRYGHDFHELLTRGLAHYDHESSPDYDGD